jgi:hypothetical protein
MSKAIIQRINTIEREMVGEMDLSHIARERVEPELLAACVASGQVDSRQIAAHQAAGELRLTEKDGGYECGMLHVTFAGPEPKSARVSWKALLFLALAAGGFLSGIAYALLQRAS